MTLNRSVLEISVLGPVELAAGEVVRLPLKQRRLLAALLIRVGEVCSVDALLDAVWGDFPPRSAHNLLQVYVSQLRKALPGPARIVTVGSGYALDVDTASLAAARFERLLREGTEAIGNGNLELAASLLRRALGLWRGPAYGELAYEDFARAEAERLEELRLECAEERVEAELALGRHAELLPELRSLGATYPFRERAQAQLILALYRSGRQTEALDVYAALRRYLADELGLEPGQELRDLQRRILRHDHELAAKRSPSPQLGTLPVSPDILLGRERELAELDSLLRGEQVRLVTLTGAGGSGKTRLALEAARGAAAAFANGAVFVDLAPLRDSELVPRAIATAIGIEQEPGDARDSLRAALATRELLVLLDNAEHLEGAFRGYAELLAEAPRLTLLVTSRVVLHLSGEHVYPVEPLAAEPARALFHERARQVAPQLRLTEQDEAAIAAVCARVDGLPLAIELAAGRIRSLTPAELLERLEPRIPLLAGGPRDLPARQRTLRATLEWSYELLEGHEQQDLERIAVFAGGCSLEAAEAVFGASVDRLTALVDHNLLQHRTDGGISCYTMLETIREFGLERLAESGEQSAMVRAHAEYFLALAEAAERRGASYTPEWLTRLESERDNFRAAMRGALDGDRPLLALRLAIALGPFWVIRAHAEGHGWLSEALDATPDAPTDVRAKALRELCTTPFLTGDYERSAARAEQALELFRELGDRPSVAWTLEMLAAPVGLLGDAVRARALVDESLALFRELGDRKGTLYPLSRMAFDEWQRGDRELGIALTEETVALAREAGDSWWEAGQLASLADMLWELGELARAAALARECLSLARELGSAFRMIYAFAVLAVLAAADGDPGRAGRLWGAAETLEESGQAVFRPGHRNRYADAVFAASGAELEAGLAESRAMTLDEAVELALA